MTWSEFVAYLTVVLSLFGGMAGAYYLTFLR